MAAVGTFEILRVGVTVVSIPLKIEKKSATVFTGCHTTSQVFWMRAVEDFQRKFSQLENSMKGNASN